MKTFKMFVCCVSICLLLFECPITVMAEESEVNSEELKEELLYDEMEMMAQLVEAEAGDQDLEGMRLVVSVVLNRVHSDNFPNTVEEVIYQKGQFSVIKNGAFDRAGDHISDNAYEAVRLEYEEQSNTDIIYFGTKKKKYMANGSFKHQDHWFGW